MVRLKKLRVSGDYAAIWTARQKEEEILSWLRRRCEMAQRIEAKANALVRALVFLAGGLFSRRPAYPAPGLSSVSGRPAGAALERGREGGP